MKPQWIKPPVRLDARTQRLVDESFEKALEDFDEEDLLLISERIGSKLEALRVSRTHWIRELWIVASAFHLMLLDHEQGIRELRPEVRRLVGIGLHHLVEPFDVIPDHIAGDGHLDDAHVLWHCIAKIDQQAPRLVGNYVRRAKRDSAVKPCR
jgi:uncharacterized membrane protein YkvA (DUF1232 family)